MEAKVKEILEKFRDKTLGVFVDEANVFYSQKELGWRVDWSKFLQFLRKFSQVTMARYYMGMPLDKKAYEQNILVKNRLEKSGFEVVIKPLKKIYTNKEKSEFKNKCNFDVEITCDVIRNLEKVEVVLVASNDSDFIGLKNDVISHKKGFAFVCFKNTVAWEIRKSYHIFFDDIKSEIEYIKQ